MEKILNALIVGGSSGIGEAIAQKLDIYNVINVSRTPCLTEGVINFLGDVSKKEDRDRIVGEIKAAVDKLDLFIYSAGSSMSAPFEYTREENYRYLFEVNFFGCVELLKGLLPLLKISKGQVIFVSSIASKVPIPFDPFYDASKAAMNALSTELNVELRPYGVKVLSALVGGTKTGFSFKRLVYEQDEAKEYYDDSSCAASTLERIEQSGGDVNAVADKIIASIGKEGTKAIGFVAKLSSFFADVICDKSLIFILGKLFCR